MSRVSSSVLVLFVLSAVTLAGENWPAWRGPSGNGISDSTGVPTEWSLEQNIVWKAELPSWSGGTPVIWGDRIFVTSPSKDQPAAGNANQAGGGDEPTAVQDQDGQRGQGQRQGRRGQGRGQGRRGGGGGFGGGVQSSPGGDTLMLLCLSKADGKELWSRPLDTGNRIWRKQNNTSPSPVTDGTHVWAVTGTGEVACFDLDGKPVWNANLQDLYGEFGLNWGYASSPLLYDGKLIIEVLHGMRTNEPSYVVAFDAASGKEAWRVERPTDAISESPDAYTTPVLVEHEGRITIVVSGGDYVTGHDPATGNELWRAGGLNPQRSQNFRIVGSPTVMDDMIYVPTRNQPLLAIRPGGSGDVTRSHLAFKLDQRGADVPSPVSDGKFLYIVTDQGLISCLDAKDGTLVYGPQRTTPGTVSSSPVIVDGKLYFVNEQAETVVLETGPEYKLVSVNKLDGEYTLSSIAVSESRLYIRTAKALYCIGNAGAE